MKKKILLIFLLFICFKNFGQNLEERVVFINTIEEANAFFQSNQSIKGDIIEVSPQIEENSLFSNRIKNEVFSDENNIYKILEIKKTKAFKVNYIFLDGNKLSLDSINNLRKNIVEEYKNGIAFLDLVKKYTMDGNLSGDLGWFTEGMMVPEFEYSIKNHKLNEIFAVDVSNEKWYYVVLKSFQEKDVDNLTVLKIIK